jgi:hypothetical protein
VVLQFNTEEIVMKESEDGSLQQFAKRESSTRIADGAKQGSVRTAEADSKLNVTKGLQEFSP